MPEFHFNPFDPLTQRDPFPAYARGRKEFPLYRHAGLPVVSVFRYGDTLRILRDAETFSNVIQRELPPGERRSMLSSDPPEHTRLRKLVNQAFTPRIVGELEDWLWSVAHELMDEALERRSVDFVDALAYPLPVIAIAHVLGVPAEERAVFRDWSDTLISSGGGTPLLGQAPSPEQEAGRVRVRREMHDYFTRMAEARRREPQDDLISGLVAAELEGSRLSFDEMLEMLILLLVAGNETTTNLIGNAAIQLLDHRDALAALRAEPGLLPTALEEVLRFDSPVQADPRRVTRDAELNGEKLAADTTLICWLGSANRDEEAFAAPEVLDIRREPNRHVAFGFGQHFCLGANLARLEARVAIGAFLERTAGFERADGEPLPLHPSFFFRGFRSIPMELTPA